LTARTLLIDPSSILSMTEVQLRQYDITYIIISIPLRSVYTIWGHCAGASASGRPFPAATISAGVNGARDII
jgi:hypothetical protein